MAGPKKQLQARWWTTAGDKIVEMPPVRVHVGKAVNAAKQKKRRKSA